MKNLKKWMCLLAVVTMLANVSACGNQSEQISQPDPTSESREDDAEPEDYLNEPEETGDDAPIKEEDLIIRGEETTPAATTTASAAETKAESTTTAQTTATQPASTSAVQNAETDTPATQVPKQTDAPATQFPETQAPATQPVQTTPAPTEAPVDPENVVSGICDLSSKSCEGEGISFNGNTLSITGEGTYVISGNLLDGMIDISTKQKVKLKLNGVNISNSTGPGIMVNDAKRLTITLIEGTINTVSGGSTANDGAICTNDTLEIKGAGTLHVNGTVEHGISSDDDVVIKNGNIHINAVKTGIMANDDITISGGTLNVIGKTNGMKSKGTLHIAGGSIHVTGGPKETKSGLFSMTTFTLTGGSLYVIGCGAAEPDPATSTQNSIAVKFSPSIAGGGSALISSGGSALFDARSDTAFNTIFVSTPDIREGMEFQVYANGTDCGLFTTNLNMTSVTAAY